MVTIRLEAAASYYNLISFPLSSRWANSVSRIIDRPPHQINGCTDVLPALRLKPHSAFLAAYRLSRLSCLEALERSTSLDLELRLEDPFTTPLGLTGHPTIPPQSIRPTNGVQHVLPCCLTRTTQRYRTGHRQSTSS